MCSTHHLLFDAYAFFIRYFPDVSLTRLCFRLRIHRKQIRKFVLVNYSNRPTLQQFHGKAVALDIQDRHAPFPSLFILHEMRVRGFHPFEPVAPTVADNSTWQDWISSDGVFNNASGSFNRASPPGNPNSSVSPQQRPQFHPTTTGAGDASSGGRTAALNADVIADILTATRAIPSWKACQMEGTSWTGTGEETIQKYVSSIGVQDPSPP